MGSNKVQTMVAHDDEDFRTHTTRLNNRPSNWETISEDAHTKLHR